MENPDVLTKKINLRLDTNLPQYKTYVDCKKKYETKRAELKTLKLTMDELKLICVSASDRSKYLS